MNSITELLDMSDQTLEDYIAYVHAVTGITIPKHRKTMVQGRMRRRIQDLRLPGYEAYLELVKADKKERVYFIDQITTNETYFYRTPRIWEHVENVFLPTWFKGQRDQTLKVWSAAASSGEEAHTLGILCQNFKRTNPSFNYQILGTDISTEMVQTCQRGVYSGRSIEQFKTARPELFNQYMVPYENGFRAIPEIRQSLRFEQHNLFGPLREAPVFDLILLRNVLIYFTPVDQEKVLGLIHKNLASQGELIIGESESLTHVKTSFQSLVPLVYRKSA